MIYCAYDTLNPSVDHSTSQEIHVCGKYVCGKYNTIYCYNCASRYDGDRIKEYIATHERIEQ